MAGRPNRSKEHAYQAAHVRHPRQSIGSVLPLPLAPLTPMIGGYGKG